MPTIRLLLIVFKTTSRTGGPICGQGSFYFSPALKASSSVGGPLLWPEVSNDLGRGEQGPKGLPASGPALSTQTHKHM